MSSLTDLVFINVIPSTPPQDHQLPRVTALPHVILTPKRCSGDHTCFSFFFFWRLSTPPPALRPSMHVCTVCGALAVSPPPLKRVMYAAEVLVAQTSAPAPSFSL